MRVAKMRLARLVVVVVSATMFLPSTCVAWTSTTRGASPIHHSKTTRLFNVPPPSAAADDPVALKTYANREKPPASFYELQINCARAAKLAMADGHLLLEIEFPPLAAKVLEMDDVSAYDVAAANLELAIDFSKNLVQDGGGRNKVAILFPDEAELDIAAEKIGTRRPHPNIEISSLRKSKEGDDRLFKPEQVFLSLFGGGSGGTVQKMDDVDVYVCLVASAQELPDIEELHMLDPTKTIFFYNLKLDVLRGDLGAPAFPGKVRACVCVCVCDMQKCGFVWMSRHYGGIRRATACRECVMEPTSLVSTVKVPCVVLDRRRMHEQNEKRKPFLLPFAASCVGIGCLATITNSLVHYSSSIFFSTSFRTFKIDSCPKSSQFII